MRDLSGRLGFTALFGVLKELQQNRQVNFGLNNHYPNIPTNRSNR